MTTITTKLIKDGNSIAVRLPKSLLQMSGLGSIVELEARQGQITVRRGKRARHNWETKIAIAAEQAKKAGTEKDLIGWEETVSDGLDEL